MEGTRRKWVIGALTSIASGLIVWWLTTSVLVRKDYAVAVDRHDYGRGRKVNISLSIENVGQKPLQDYVIMLTVLTSQKLEFEYPRDCAFDGLEGFENSTDQKLTFACSLLNPDETMWFKIKFTAISDPCITYEAQVNVMIKATGFTGRELTRPDEEDCRA